MMTTKRTKCRIQYVSAMFRDQEGNFNYVESVIQVFLYGQVLGMGNFYGYIIRNKCANIKGAYLRTL